jgi:hypothetical protein
MSANRCPVVTLAALLFCLCVVRAAQAQETPKVEIGVQFTALDLGDFKLAVLSLSDSQRGVGARVTVNLSDNISVEGEFNTFPNNFRLTLPQLGNLVTRELTRDRVDQFLFGVKLGARSDHFGIFAKLRPGYVRSVLQDQTTGNTNPTLNTLFRTTSGWALDVGGVFEFYPSRHTMLRLDAGDTIIRYETKSQNATGQPTTRTFRNHTLQVSAGFGLRF